MEDFKNRKRYKSVDRETLDSIKDEDLEQAIVDYICDEAVDDWSRDIEILTAMPKGFMVIWATRIAEGEVSNGGFNQFFYNSSSRYVIEAIEGFDEIGAPKSAATMKKAFAIAVKEFPTLKKVKEEGTLEAFFESYKDTELTTVDKEFYNSGEDLSALRIKYIREHPDHFVGR